MADDEHGRLRPGCCDLPEFERGRKLRDARVYGVLDEQRERGVRKALNVRGRNIRYLDLRLPGCFGAFGVSAIATVRAYCSR